MFSLPENSGLHQIFKEFCKCRSMRFVFSHGAKDLFHKVLINVKILIQGEARLFATIWFCMSGSYLKFQFSCLLLSKCRSYLCAACTLFKNNVSFLYTRLNSGNYPCFVFFFVKLDLNPLAIIMSLTKCSMGQIELARLIQTVSTSLFNAFLPSTLKYAFWYTASQYISKMWFDNCSGFFQTQLHR